MFIYILGHLQNSDELNVIIFPFISLITLLNFYILKLFLNVSYDFFYSVLLNCLANSYSVHCKEDKNLM